jgi:hypothetical protein
MKKSTKYGICAVLCTLAAMGGVTSAYSQISSMVAVTINNSPGDQYDPHVSRLGVSSDNSPGWHRDRHHAAIPMGISRGSARTLAARLSSRA